MIALNPDVDFRRRLERYILCVGARVVARQAKVSRQSVYKWLHGTMPRDERLRVLEDAIERHEARVRAGSGARRSGPIACLSGHRGRER